MPVATTNLLLIRIGSGRCVDNVNVRPSLQDLTRPDVNWKRKRKKKQRQTQAEKKTDGSYPERLRLSCGSATVAATVASCIEYIKVSK